MKRTTIFMEEQALRQLQRAARRKGVTTATVVREAVAQYLQAPSAAGMIPSLAGKFASGTSDTSERTDQLLWRDPHQ